MGFPEIVVGHLARHVCVVVHMRSQRNYGTIRFVVHRCGQIIDAGPVYPEWPFDPIVFGPAHRCDRNMRGGLRTFLRQDSTVA